MPSKVWPTFFVNNFLRKIGFIRNFKKIKSVFDQWSKMYTLVWISVIQWSQSTNTNWHYLDHEGQTRIEPKFGLIWDCQVHRSFGLNPNLVHLMPTRRAKTNPNQPDCISPKRLDLVSLLWMSFLKLRTWTDSNDALSWQQILFRRVGIEIASLVWKKMRALTVYILRQ